MVYMLFLINSFSHLACVYALYVVCDKRWENMIELVTMIKKEIMSTSVAAKQYSNR